MIDRQQQIALMDSAEERTTGYLRAWLRRPEVQEDLHRFDVNGNDKRPAKRSATR